jgi:glucose/arabinose dehydrogenase
MGADYRNPVKSYFATPNRILKDVLNETRNRGYADWTSVAPSSIDVYTSSAIPGWQNSLLIPTLKTGELIRVKLNEMGDGIVGDTMSYFKAHVRYRDVAISHDGKKIYMAMDSSTYSSGPTQGRGTASNCRGCIVEYTYQGKGNKLKAEQ